MTVCAERRMSLLDQAPDVLWPWMICLLVERLGRRRVARAVFVDEPLILRYQRGELPTSRVREAATRLFANELASELEEHEQ